MLLSKVSSHNSRFQRGYSLKITVSIFSKVSETDWHVELEMHLTMHIFLHVAKATYRTNSNPEFRIILWKVWSPYLTNFFFSSPSTKKVLVPMLHSKSMLVVRLVRLNLSSSPSSEVLRVGVM